MKTIKFITISLSLLFCSNLMAKPSFIWPSTPFIRGLDACGYHQAYSQTRFEYMQDMTQLATELMSYGALGSEALEMLINFDALYEKHKALAVQGRFLDVTLENTLKAFLDSFYNNPQYRTRTRNVYFKHANPVAIILRQARRNTNVNVPNNILDHVDYVAYGSYTLAPNCQGNINATLTLVGKDNITETFQATGRPTVVMSSIAAQIFNRFQQTKFPSKLRIGSRTITLLGALNGRVDTVRSVKVAKQSCTILGGRLPSESELEIIDSYGDWNGGVSIGRAVWALHSGKVYHPGLGDYPVRNVSEVNTRKFNYYCIK